MADIWVTAIDTILSSWSFSTLRLTHQKPKHFHFIPHASFIGLTLSRLVKLFFVSTSLLLRVISIAVDISDESMH
jgi:hypothetical protein